MQLLGGSQPPVTTTLACLTEAMHMVGRVQQPILTAFIRRGLFQLTEFTLADTLRACDLMERYADAPMDFADASLVVTAEKTGITRILTFDRHFYAYRIHGKTPFDVVA